MPSFGDDLLAIGVYRHPTAPHFRLGSPSAPGAPGGSVVEGQAYTIAGTGFGTKATAAPRFFWTADDGIHPNSRQTAWGGSFTGEVSSVIVAPGSTQAVRHDHGLDTTSTEILGRVDFAAGPATKMYFWRKKYDDFDITRDYAVRIEVSGNISTWQPGDALVDDSNGATGTLLWTETWTGGGFLYLDQHDETTSISHDKFRAGTNTDFAWNQNLTNTTRSQTVVNAEGNSSFPTGTFRTFNDKPFRIWNSEYVSLGYATGRRNNVYHAAQGRTGAGFYVVAENLFDGQQSDGWGRQNANVWEIEEFEFANDSSVGARDAKLRGYRNGAPAGETDSNFRVTSSGEPNYMRHLYQRQVSNQAYPGSYTYFDALYLDECWNRVYLSNSATWAGATDREIQVPTAWSDSSVTFLPRFGGLDSAAQLYAYVVDGAGSVANTAGIAVG